MVRIVLQTRGRNFRVSVIDNGPASAPDQRHIFEKFHQGSGGTEKPVGTGLGLPISRRIIGHLGGRIWVESRPGKGATLYLRVAGKRRCLRVPGESNDENRPDRGR